MQEPQENQQPPVQEVQVQQNNDNQAIEPKADYKATAKAMLESMKAASRQRSKDAEKEGKKAIG
jgi:hypothetical protein